MTETKTNVRDFISAVHGKMENSEAFKNGILNEYLNQENETLIEIIGELSDANGAKDSFRLAKAYAQMLKQSKNHELSNAYLDLGAESVLAL